MSTKEFIYIIDDILPQIQCKKCGYEDCISYANAIVNENANISLCDPGGNTVTKKIANKLKIDNINQSYSERTDEQLKLAYIKENDCIGCTLCIKKCPVSAIIGSNKLMHSVIQDWCTGCELCLPACPVDCIEMKPSGRTWTKEDAETARKHHESTKERMYKNSANKYSLMCNDYEYASKEKNVDCAEKDKKKALIAKILKKARDIRAD